MRWLSFFIFAYIVLGLQSGIARAMEWHSAGPNFVLVAVVFISLSAPREAALLGCFMLGAMQDLTSQSTLGLFAFSYGLVAIFIVAIQKAVYRRHPIMQFILVLLAGCLTAIILALHGWIRPPGPATAPFFVTAVYSAILAPLILGGLQRIEGVFHFQSRRRRI
jgi:rod shape-determining protein MreD